MATPPCCHHQATTAPFRHPQAPWPWPRPPSSLPSHQRAPCVAMPKTIPRPPWPLPHNSQLPSHDDAPSWQCPSHARAQHDDHKAHCSQLQSIRHAPVDDHQAMNEPSLAMLQAPAPSRGHIPIRGYTETTKPAGGRQVSLRQGRAMTTPLLAITYTDQARRGNYQAPMLFVYKSIRRARWPLPSHYKVLTGECECHSSSSPRHHHATIGRDRDVAKLSPAVTEHPSLRPNSWPAPFRS